MGLLSEEAIADEHARLSGWERSGDAIVKTVTLADFAAAMELVNTVAGAAEEHDHHPDITIRYNRVTLTLSTHSAGGLTARDFAMARRIDELTG